MEDNLRNWEKYASISPLEYLTKYGYNNATDLLGVKKVVPAQALLDIYGAYGAVSPKMPTTVFAALTRNPRAAETMAHEAEHVRQFSAPQRIKDTMLDKDKVPWQAINQMASNLSGYNTVQSQPTLNELLAFLRGKEAIGEIGPNQYNQLPNDARNYLYRALFLGQDKWVPPDNSFPNPKETQGLGWLDKMRRAIRNYTAN